MDQPIGGKEDRWRTWDLKDGLWPLWVRDVDGIGGVIDDDGAVLARKGNQLLQLLARRCSASRVVGIAEEYEVCSPCLQSTDLSKLARLCTLGDD